jgi:threonine synthase
MSFLIHLECTGCHLQLKPDKLWNLCPKCNKPLFARYDLKQVMNTIKKEEILKRSTHIWRYKEVLPVHDSRCMLTLGEGNTPLINAKGLEAEFNHTGIFIKDEGLNPTGSFKARGLCVAVSKALELGVQSLSIPSAGNAAGAMSAYCALAGIPAFVYMPSDVPDSFKVECTMLGASVKLIDGLITDCGNVAMREARKYNRFDLSTLKEPYRIEGKKTMGYEIIEQMRWVVPDVIIYPTGGGTGFIGMWKAFAEMEMMGWINSKRPKMVAVQAVGCAPIVKAFRAGYSSAEVWQKAYTIADGLRVPAAIGDFLILDIIRKSQGTAIQISDSEMLEGMRILGETQGLFASPESGATVIALRKLLQENWIKKDDKIVLFNTGSGYKYSHLINSE